MLLKLTILALVVATVFGARPGWNHPSPSASIIRWNGCASNDETYAILAIQDGSNPKSTFTHSNNVNNVWNILACDITLPGNLVMQFGREIVVGASTVNRLNAIRFNINSDGVEDLEFNKNGNWVSLTGLVSSQNAPGSSTNFATRNNLVAPLNGVAANPAFGSAFSSAKNNPANNCRQGPKVVLGANGVYASLLTTRNYASGAFKSVTAFLCNYDTDVTATSICAAGIYRPVSLASGASTSFTCTPEANDFAFATVNGLAQYVVSTTCGPNICGIDFTTCTALPAPGILSTLGTWYCESNNDPASIVPLVAGNPGVVTATDAANIPFAFANIAGPPVVQIFLQGYVRISPAGSRPAITPGAAGNYNTGGGNNFDFPVFNTVAYNAGSGQVLYQIAGGLMTIQWQGVSVGNLGTYSAQIVLSSNAGAVTPTVTYIFNGDGGAGVSFDTFGSPLGGINVNVPFGCYFSTQKGADVDVVLPYKALGFSLAGLDARGRFRLMNYDPAVGLTPFYSIVSNGSPNTLPPAISVPAASLGGFVADAEVAGQRFTVTRCCRSGTRVTGTVLSSGTNAMVFYAQYVGFAGSVYLDIIARGLTGGTTTWTPATQVGLSTTGSTTAATGPNPQRGFVGSINQGVLSDINVDIRGIVSTYVSPTPGVAGSPNYPMVIFSRRQPGCRFQTGDTMTPGTSSGQLFEYIAGICKDVACSTGIDWRILADSNQLASGNLAEMYSSLASDSPLPELLAVTLSAKSGFPVVAVGSTAALPVVLECLDYQCNSIQSTVGDDYLGGHWGESFVVAGQKQLTLVSQAAWGIATEMKPYAQQWNAFTTAPDGLTQCNAANAGKSFNVVGRVYICTRLPRGPQGVTSAVNPATPFNRPIASAIFQWTEVGGRARLYATENAA